MNRKQYVLVVGDINTDLVVQLPASGPDGQIDMPEPRMTGGGSCANTAYALHRLGVSVEFAGTVGDDTFGRMVLEEFRERGIGTGNVQVDPGLNTVCVFAFVRPDGERSLWAWPKERASFRFLDKSGVDCAVVDRAAWVHAGGMVYSGGAQAGPAVTAILQRAWEKGVPTSFDLNLRPENGALDEACRHAVMQALEYCRYVLGSAEEEFSYLRTGRYAGNGIVQAESFARGGRVVVARMGEKGSLAITPEGRVFAPAFPARVADTIGAGDVYNAGFIAAMLEGFGPGEAIRWGNAAAAHSVCRTGPRTGPDRGTLQKILRDMEVNPV